MGSTATTWVPLCTVRRWADSAMSTEYGSAASFTSAALTHPTEPLGRIGRSTLTQSPWDCSTRNTSGAPFSLGLDRVVCGAAAPAAEYTATLAGTAWATYVVPAASVGAPFVLGVVGLAGCDRDGTVVLSEVPALSPPPPPPPQPARAPTIIVAATSAAVRRPRTQLTRETLAPSRGGIESPGSHRGQPTTDLSTLPSVFVPK